MCDCFKIGGPWIEEDPDCPVHGLAAQRRAQDEAEEREHNLSQLQWLERSIRQAEDLHDIKTCMLELTSILKGGE